MLNSIRTWLALRQGKGRAKASSQRPKNLLRLPRIDTLEDRRLLSVSSPQPQDVVASPLAAGVTVVGRSVFYNNSLFDGFTPAATAADSAAIATDKIALLPGQTATFANYTGSLAGINGIMVDVAGLAGTPTAADFLFHVGNNTALGSWADAPQPSGFTVQAGAGIGGSTRITIVWPDGLIRNQWLQVDVRATGNTGLAQPDVFYFGNAVGDTGNSALNTQVNMTDQLAVRANGLSAGQVAPITSRYDFNRDGLINSTDERIVTNFTNNLANSLQLFKPAETYVWSDVVSRNVFYNNSSFDGNDVAANSADDGAVASDKRALLPGQAATFANYTSYSRGLNGVMIDIAGSPQTLTSDDFEFRVGNDVSPAQWSSAPNPSGISIRYGAGVGGSARVTLVWPDGAIAKQWLQVTVKATSRTRLATADVFYFGNTIGETGDATSAALVNTTDLLRVSGGLTTGAVGIQSVLDINRDNRVDSLDRDLVLANLNSPTNALKLLAFGSPAPIEPTAQTPFEPVYTNFAYSNVVARNIFYNSSSFDGNSPLAAAADASAVATDKQALLPGELASFANYTSYSRGINGILVDVAGLPGSPTADDFLFRVGNSNVSGQWATAPAPLSVTVNRGAGMRGSDRLTIVWADNAIQNQWLQVTLKATAATGLKSADVFYFGNAVGEAGNSTANARVDQSDRLLVRNNNAGLTIPVPLTSRFDFNRDGIVDDTDEQIAVRNVSLPQPLQLFTPPLEAADTQPQREPLELFHRGDSAYNVFFGPNLVQTNSGTILALAEGRWNQDDQTSFAIVQRRSTDGGATWSEITTVAGIAPFTTETISNASAVVDAMTGEIFVVYVKNWSLVFVTSSTDDGLSWSTPTEITTDVKVTSQGNPNPSAFSDAPWGWYVVGPGHGIQLQQGANAGRLMIAGDHRISEDRSTPSWSHVIYSDDHGRTWHLGGGVDQTVKSNEYSNEASVVEQSDGAVYMSIRMNNGSAFRGYSRSYDGGMTWSDVQIDQQLTTFGVQASMLRVDANTVLLSAPDSSDGTRRQMTIWISRDNMQTWVKTKAVYYSYAGYSDLTLAGPDTVLLAYNRGNMAGNSAQSIGLARFNLEWLEDGQSDQFLWHFNEQPAGTKANIAGTSIQDYSPWDNRAIAQANSQAEAPTYVAGAGSNLALRLTTGSDSVLLTPVSTNALQFGAQDSFSVELAMRTSASAGVMIGGTPGVRGWTLRLVNGKPQLDLFDGTTTVSVTSTVAINDGNWHRVAVVRDAQAHRLRVYVDGVLAAPQVVDTTASLISTGPVTLGAMNDGSGQLAFDIDTLRITRGTLTQAQLLPASFAEPARYQAPPYRNGAPNTLPNLQFWLPSFDPTRYFADLGYSDPMPLAPVSGTATRSAIDASSNGYKVTVGTISREIMYTTDPEVGPNWLHSALTLSAGEPWIVQNSNGTSPTNFDFVQNTGVFTLSTFVKIGANMGANMALFDTAESVSTNSGFTLLVTPQGALTTLIVGQSGNIRFNQTTTDHVVQSGTWYHIAVVGSGPGNPLKYYVTPVSDPTVNAFQSSRLILGANGNYATNADHNLTIGALARTGNASFNGQMVDQAIYNRALTPAEIQQLFDYTTSGK